MQKGDRLTGKTGQSIYEHISNYIDTCKNINASDEPKLQFFHYNVNDKARRLYRSIVQQIGKTFLKECSTSRNLFYYPRWQNRLSEYIHSSPLATVMKKRNVSVSEELNVFRENSTTVDAQDPPNHRIKMNLVIYMNDAVASLDWAQIPITQCATADNPWNIRNIFTALNAVWLHPENSPKPKQQCIYQR